MPIDDRYQNQTWYVKAWRRRHYLPALFRAVKFWWRSRNVLIDSKDPESREWSFRDGWSISLGISQSKMKWYYTSEEVMGRLKEKREARAAKADRS